MYKKVISIVLTIVMLVFCVPTSAFASSKSIFDKMDEAFKTAVNQNEVISSANFEGIVVSCKYVKSTQKYLLYWDKEEYGLNVTFDKGDVFVDILDTREIKDKNVYGQNPVLLPLVFLTPEAIAVIQGVVIATAATVTAIGTAYLSTELIEQIAEDYTYTTNVDVSAANAAVSAMTSGVTLKTEYDDSYFEAALQNDGTVFIGRLLKYKDALARLRLGYDIFSVDQSKANFLAKVASPVNKSKGPEIHGGDGIRYYHFHPVGISWYKNKRHLPHVWYL